MHRKYNSELHINGTPQVSLYGNTRVWNLFSTKACLDIYDIIHRLQEIVD